MYSLAVQMNDMIIVQRDLQVGASSRETVQIESNCTRREYLQTYKHVKPTFRRLFKLRSPITSLSVPVVLGSFSYFLYLRTFKLILHSLVFI